MDNNLYNKLISWTKDNPSDFSALAGAAGNMAGSLIGGGMDSTAGDIMKAASGVAAMVPGPLGAGLSAGLGVLGGITNRLFGSKLNQGNIDNIKSNITQLNNFTSDVGSFDELSESWLHTPSLPIFSKRDLGKEGIFSNKVSKLYKNFVNQGRAAEEHRDLALMNNMENIAENQYLAALGNYRMGGPLSSYGANWSNGLVFIDNGGTHSQNPLGGVPIGISQDGMPNLVEEGEVIWNDYVFSNRIKVPKKTKDKLKLRITDKDTFADAVKKVQKESEERPNDPISKRGLEDVMNRLMIEQEMIRQKRNNNIFRDGGGIYIAPSKKGTFTAAAKKRGMGVQEFASKVLANPDNYSEAMRKKAQFAKNASKWGHSLGGYLFPDGGYVYTPTIERTLNKMFNNSLGYEDNDIVYNLPPVTSTPDVLETKRNPFTALRYAPVVGSALGVFSDLMGWANRPESPAADAVLNSVNSLRETRATPIGDYLQYTPLDRLFYSNQLAGQSGATRSNILNTSAGNRGAARAGLLAADYNSMIGLGNLYRQAEEYNLGQRERVSTFNRATNMFNAEQDLRAQMANREVDRLKMNAVIQAAQLAEDARNRASQARSLNLTNLFDNLGNVGIDAYNKEDRDRLIRAGIYGTLSQRPAGWTDKQWNDYKNWVATRPSFIGKNGGKLKRKKGLTYG